MKLTDLTQEQLMVAYVELVLSRSHLVSRAFGELEQYYLDRADLLEPVIDVFRELVRLSGGDSDGI